MRRTRQIKCPRPDSPAAPGGPAGPAGPTGPAGPASPSGRHTAVQRAGRPASVRLAAPGGPDGSGPRHVRQLNPGLTL